MYEFIVEFTREKCAKVFVLCMLQHEKKGFGCIKQRYKVTQTNEKKRTQSDLTPLTHYKFSVIDYFWQFFCV